MVETFDMYIRQLGAWGYPLFGVAALLEYLAPPMPGDTLTLLGGAYVARGDRSALVLLASLMAGSLAGITVMWRVGVAVGAKLLTMSVGQRLLGIKVERLLEVSAAMRERGTWLLLVNRYLPTFRVVVFLAAGASGMPLRRVLLLGGFSALTWNTMLMMVGFLIGDSAERIDGFLRTYKVASVSVVVVLACLAGVYFLRRRYLRSRA